MSDKERTVNKSSRSLASKYDRTDGIKYDHCGWRDVAAANHAVEGVSHE